MQHDVADDSTRGIALYEALVSQNTAVLSTDEWADRLEAIERTKSRLAALEAEAIAGFDDALHGVSADLGHRHPEPGDRLATPGERRWHAGDLRSVADEIALILNVRKNHATRLIHTSCELVHNFPATLHALREGDLTERAAFTIVDQLSVLDDLADIRAAEAAVLAWAATHPLADIKQECQAEAARRSPVASDKRHQRAHDERSVQLFPDGDGRATIVHSQDAVDAAAIMTSLSRSAARHRRNGDPRTMDQLRADIAASRLLPGTKHRNSNPAPNEPAGTTCNHPTDTTSGSDTIGYEAGNSETGGARCDTANPSPPVEEPPDDPDYEPDDRSIDDYAGVDTEPDLDLVDEASIGAEATVVIHATGAEALALINGEVATGGDVEHHGPIPQNSLRKHLVKALTQRLIPNLPTTPNSPRPGAATRRPRTTSTTSTTKVSPGATHSSGARLELRITDQPPPSDPDRYTPSAALDRYVRLRDRTCQFPGCNRPAEFTDVDHRMAFAAGGRTTAANLWCLCRHHHRLKHEGGWETYLNADGSWTWVSPTGRHYRNNPTTIDPPPNLPDPMQPGTLPESGESATASDSPESATRPGSSQRAAPPGSPRRSGSRGATENGGPFD